MLWLYLEHNEAGGGGARDTLQACQFLLFWLVTHLTAVSGVLRWAAMCDAINAAAVLERGCCRKNFVLRAVSRTTKIIHSSINRAYARQKTTATTS